MPSDLEEIHHRTGLATVLSAAVDANIFVHGLLPVRFAVRLPRRALRSGVPDPQVHRGVPLAGMEK